MLSQPVVNVKFQLQFLVPPGSWDIMHVTPHMYRCCRYLQQCNDQHQLFQSIGSGGGILSNSPKSQQSQEEQHTVLSIDLSAITRVDTVIELFKLLCSSICGQGVLQDHLDSQIVDNRTPGGSSQSQRPGKLSRWAVVYNNYIASLSSQHLVPLIHLAHMLEATIVSDMLVVRCAGLMRFAIPADIERMMSDSAATADMVVASAAIANFTHTD